MPRRSARGSLTRKNPYSWYVPGGEMVQPDFGEAPLWLMAGYRLKESRAKVSGQLSDDRGGGEQTPTDLPGQCEQVGHSLAPDDDLRTWLRDEEAQLLTLLLLTTDVDASGRFWMPKSPGASCDLLRRSMVDSRGPGNPGGHRAAPERSLGRLTLTSCHLHACQTMNKVHAISMMLKNV